MEAEILKCGLTKVKILEKVYALPKNATTGDILNAARAEESAQRHLKEVEKVHCDHNLSDSKSTEELKAKGKKYPD